LATNESGPITELLIRWGSGDEQSLNSLVPLVEAELRQIAYRQMRKERRGHALQTTALVNEAYLRLVNQTRVDWQNRAHFMAVAARLMRQILVDHARRRSCEKRGGRAPLLPLADGLVFSDSKSRALVALEDALNDLHGFDPRKSHVVELRFFGGLSVEGTAAVLCVHPKTVQRDWTVAKAWLTRELSRKSANAG
jgi:RNA polymerase sigma factor (TIGR02999 family)